MQGSQRSKSAFLCAWCYLSWWHIARNIEAVLHSNFLQPGNGIIKETWYKAENQGLDAYIGVEAYPTCPDVIENLDDFNDAPKYEDSNLKYIMVRYKGYFIPPETGSYRFYVKCQEKCSFKIEGRPSELRKVIEVHYRTSLHCWDCIASQYSRNIHLYKSVRYYIEVFRVGSGSNDFAGLGVRMPSGSFERPIRKNHLQRTLSLYNWNGMLAEYYNIASGTRPDLKNMSSQPTEVSCMKQTYDDRKRDNFAIRATGYFLPAESGTYKVYLKCKSRCVFYFITNGTEVKIAEQNEVATFAVIGTLIKGEKYFMRIDFYKDDGGGTSFFIKRMKDPSSYVFFMSAETRTLSTEPEVIPDPAYTVNNATSITMHWNQTILPIQDKFNLSGYYIKFWPLDNISDIHQLTITDRFSTSKLLTNLGVWRKHQADLWYIGMQYTLRASTLVFKTGEGVPSVPPIRVVVVKDTSTSIIVRWGTIPLDQRHGVLIGFDIRYKKEGEHLWMNISSDRVGVREKTVTGLRKYTVYGFKVAGKTSAGIGVYSEDFNERTNEDAPTAAPVGISANNLTSTVLEVTWGEVPFEGRNGIIRVYVIYYKLKGAPETDWEYTKASGSVNKTMIFRLKYWSFYEIKVAAKTIKEGVKSNATVARTDEDVPSRPPQNLKGNATSSRSMSIKWTEIPYNYTHGIIIGYEVIYKETEGNSIWFTARTAHMFVNITGIEEYFNYTSRVAGVTSKGVGTFSKNFYLKTHQDVPSAPPDGIKARNLSANSLLVSWQKVPYRHQNGIITAYKIAYRENATIRWYEKIVDAKHQQGEIFDLKNYTWYEIRVAGITKVGVGRFNQTVYAITDENVPSASPTNFTGNNVTSRSIIVFWNSIPLREQNGIITGFRLQYRDATNKDSEWMETTFNATVNNGTIYELHMYHPYYMRIAGITSKGVGVFSKEIKVWTDEDSPDGYPMNITGEAKSSTSVYLHWNEKQTNDTNGILIGYRVYYQIVKCPEDRPLWCSESKVSTARTVQNESQINLTGLRKFMEYMVWIRALNKIGTGPPSPKFKIKTATDIPSAPPEMVESFSNNYTSISVFWDPIRASLRNGVIIKYRIFYRLQEREVLKTHRVVRNIVSPSNVTVEGLEPGESYKDVNGSLKSTVIGNLEPFRWYIIRIGGITRAGLGPIAVFNASCGQSVSATAPQLSIYDKYSFNEISLSWSEIPSFKETRGTILEYNVQYWPSEFEMQPTLEYKVKSLTIKAPVRSAKLTQLTPFTKYGIRVAAVTQTGVGVYTHLHYGETCRCAKKIEIVKRILVPLITKHADDTFTHLVDSAIRTCCSTCVGINTTTDWEIDTHGEGILSAEDVFEEIQHGKEVYAPQFQAVHTWWHLERSYGLGKFIPILKSPGVAVIGRKFSSTETANEGANALIRGLARAYPVLIIGIILLILLGLLQWLIELGKDGSHFNDSIKHGLPQAIWFSFVTKSAVGYGDVLPSNMFIARLLAMMTMLFGIVWKVLLFSSITVTYVVYLHEQRGVFALAGKRVVVSNETHLLALKKGASVVKVFNYKQQFEAVKTVLNGMAEFALIDGLSLVNEEKVLKHPDLEIKEFLDDNQYYGVIVSGKTEKLGNCINVYMRTNKVEIQQKVGSHFGSLWDMMKKKNKVDKALSILNKDSKIFQNMIIALMAMLILAIIVGLLHEKRRRKKARMQITPEDIVLINKKDKILVTMIDDFVDAFNQRVEELGLKHAKQLIALSEKKYAVNIVPEIIEIFGDADYDKDIMAHRKSMGDCLRSVSEIEMEKISVENVDDIDALK